MDRQRKIFCVYAYYVRVLTNNKEIGLLCCNQDENSEAREFIGSCVYIKILHTNPKYVLHRVHAQYIHIKFVVCLGVAKCVPLR
jgi:hypothetical protein